MGSYNIYLLIKSIGMLLSLFNIIINSNVSILCIIVILVELNENKTGRYVIFLSNINKILVINRPVYQKHLKLGLYFLLNDNVFNSRLCAKVAEELVPLVGNRMTEDF